MEARILENSSNSFVVDKNDKIISPENIKIGKKLAKKPSFKNFNFCIGIKIGKNLVI